MLLVCQGMHKERGRIQREIGRSGNTEAVEAASITLLLDATRFDLLAGHSELALARIQAAIEFNLFRPDDLPGTCSWP